MAFWHERVHFKTCMLLAKKLHLRVFLWKHCVLVTMIFAPFFITVRNWEGTKCLSKGGWLNKGRHFQTVEACETSQRVRWIYTHDVVHRYLQNSVWSEHKFIPQRSYVYIWMWSRRIFINYTVFYWTFLENVREIRLYDTLIYTYIDSF